MAGNELRAGSLGVGAIVFFVVSAAGPLIGVAGGTPVAMLLGNGAGLSGAYVLVLALLLVFSAGYTAMARRVRSAGAFYAFTARGLGGYWGGAAAMLALLAYNAMQLGLYGIFGTATSALVADMTGVRCPWYVYAMVAGMIVARLGYLQADLSARLLGLLVFAEYVVILWLDGAILVDGGAKGIDFHAFSPEAFHSGSPAMGVLFCFASFIGFEAATIYSEEAREPRRTIRIATYAAVLLVGAFYILSTWCIGLGIGSDNVEAQLASLSDPTQLLFTLGDRYAGHGLTMSLRCLFVTSAFAGLLAFHNAIARYTYVLGRDGLLPAWLGRTHAVHASPHRGSLSQSALALGVVAITAICQGDPVLVLFSYGSGVGTLGVVMLMACTSLAVAMFNRRHGDEGLSRWEAGFSPWISVLGFGAILVSALTHFDALVQSSETLSVVLRLSLFAALALGACMAYRLRRTHPLRFAQLGHSVAR
ncbi:amino acid permease [Pandoraea cepalis]|uniref:Amino acid permease n=2 Tax=Pandoraea cepalis TaxID=2508294 RepID=A0AAW7MHV2_9BURK|nr:amino acid permease [Pandoraea cepalis]MDN4576877.1 amino acid permease [Pandoraea cepalis]